MTHCFGEIIHGFPRKSVDDWFAYSPIRILLGDPLDPGSEPIWTVAIWHTAAVDERQIGFSPVILTTTQVVQVEHDLRRLASATDELARGINQLEPTTDDGSSRRKAFWKELQAMIRLKSPHTVHLYGAITSRKDRFILVMELLPGGDLQRFLRDSSQPLPEDRARSIIRDICTGMSFLHKKETIHGDLKSPNVLFDGSGRAKVNNKLLDYTYKCFCVRHNFSC